MANMSEMKFDRVIFTDPNIPGYMTGAVGGDIDDLFMIIHAINHLPNTLIVIAGEEPFVRWNSYLE